MKKILIIFVIIGMAVALFYACKKNTDTMQTNNNTEQQYTDYEWEVFYKLQSFKQKLNSNLKGTDPMTLDSAKWYLDTQFNVEKARTEYPYKIEGMDSTYFTLILNGSGMVDITELNTMYNSMLDYLNNIIANSESIPIFGHLELLNSDDDEAEFIFRLGIGTYFSGNYAPFYYDWRFGNMLGWCDDTHKTSDAGQELKYRLNNPHFAYFKPGSFIGTDEERIIRYFNPDGTINDPDLYLDTNDEHPQPDLVNYFYYYEENDSPNYEPCLEIEELDFYLDKAHKIIYISEFTKLPGSNIHYGLRPDGLTYEWFSIHTPYGYNNYFYKYYWTHEYFIHYRLKVNIPTIPD